MTETPVTRMYDALSRGDLAAARACFTPDARIWHSFDGIAQDIETTVQGWQGLIAFTQERHIADVQTLQAPEGLVHQLVFVIRTQSGERKAWAICVVAAIQDGLITRFQEYIDRAGSFAPAEGPVTTPWL